MRKGYIIAIDGPSGSGKSTVSRALAERLGYIYIDTGAMYRAAALHAMRKGVSLSDEVALVDLMKDVDIRFCRAERGLMTMLFSEDVSEVIRRPEMSMASSAISAQPVVRARMLELQRSMGEQGRVVMEGRDIGTVVFPDADFKFYLDANAQVRARRRYAELQERGVKVDFASTLREIQKRDSDDSSRSVAPLRKAEGAVYIDTSELGVEQVVEKMLSGIDAARKKQE